jgi:primosomal protein N' (replication factor Y)
VEGRPEALAEFVELAQLPPHAELLGPVALPPERRPVGLPGAQDETTLSRLTLRAPRGEGAALVRAVKDVSSVRSARKSEGALRIRVDPVAIG